MEAASWVLNREVLQEVPNQLFLNSDFRGLRLTGQSPQTAAITCGVEQQEKKKKETMSESK